MMRKQSISEITPGKRHTAKSSGCDDTGADIVTDGKTPCNIIRFRQEIFENGFRKY